MFRLNLGHLVCLGADFPNFVTFPISQFWAEISQKPKIDQFRFKFS